MDPKDARIYEMRSVLEDMHRLLTELGCKAKPGDLAEVQIPGGTWLAEIDGTLKTTDEDFLGQRAHDMVTASRAEAERWAQKVADLVVLSATLIEGHVHFRKMAETLLLEHEEAKHGS